MLNELDNQKMHIVISTLEGLRQLLDEGFIKAEGCVFLKQLYGPSVMNTRLNHQDLTGYECFVNHIHIEDFIDVNDLKKINVLQYGIFFSQRLKDKLATIYPEEKFRIILACDIDDCNVRFHKVRPNEEWIDDNIERYNEAVMIFNI